MQHVSDTFASAGQCTGSDHQTDQQYKQDRHQDCGHFFDTSCTMADNESCQQHEDEAPNDSADRNLYALQKGRHKVI